MAELLPQENTPQIPQKMYFRIGEVSRLVGVPAYVLRFWESEFPSVAPKKSGRGHRLYRRKDVELFLEVKRLLYEKRYTIEGARKMLPSRRRAGPSEARSQPSQAALFGPNTPLLEEIRRELASILELLNKGAAEPC